MKIDCVSFKFEVKITNNADSLAFVLLRVCDQLNEADIWNACLFDWAGDKISLITLLRDDRSEAEKYRGQKNY
jgi:hypothetical protein